MTYLSSSGAYVRKDTPAGQQPFVAPGLRNTIDERVWELLKTPQTIESLQRAIVGDATQRKHIESALTRLLDAEVIELSPDS